jgi:DNA-binding IclR family transcriptional regulator
LATGTSKVIKCIEVLGKAPMGLTVSDVASVAGLSWQAANRLLDGLAADSLVIKDATTKKYRLSLRLCEWANSVIQASTPISIARKEIVKLAMETGRRCNLLVLEELDAITVERYELIDGVPTNRFVPARRVWHETASGRVIVAFLEDSQRDAILDKTYAAGARVPVTRSALEAELDVIHQRGYASSPNVSRTGSVGIVVPIRDRTTYAVAALGSVVSATEVESEKNCLLIDQMLACASTISHYLGFEQSVSAEVDS